MNPEFDFEKRYRLVREIIETIVLTLLMFLVIRLRSRTSMSMHEHGRKSA